MICIIDYGAGNIESVRKALEYIGAQCVVSADKEVLAKADAAILPGVGSFGDAMNELRSRNLEEPIKDFIASGKPFLGICLGLQILFESSEESPGAVGLGVLKGKIVRIPDGEGLKIPHMGWNSLNIKKDDALFKGVEGEPYVYFVHSYYLKAEEDIVTSTAEYGVNIHASVAKGNLRACQFHPEKSGELGIKILKNFVATIGG
jgi:imidazole glycerol-phosphate synthase subunit HisH